MPWDGRRAPPRAPLRRAPWQGTGQAMRPGPLARGPGATQREIGDKLGTKQAHGCGAGPQTEIGCKLGVKSRPRPRRTLGPRPGAGGASWCSLGRRRPQSWTPARRVPTGRLRQGGILLCLETERGQPRLEALERDKTALTFWLQPGPCLAGRVSFLRKMETHCTLSSRSPVVAVVAQAAAVKAAASFQARAMAWVRCRRDHF